MWSILGATEEPTISKEPTLGPPPATFTGVRIPADGTPAHLLSLTTIITTSTERTIDDFLIHVPDLREYWTPTHAWRRRDIDRLDLHPQNSSQRERYLEQHIKLGETCDFQRELGFRNSEQQYHFKQQLRLPQKHCPLREPHLACVGTYIVFYSFEVDKLPQNLFVPAWMSGDHGYCGEVFVVKVAPQSLGHDRGVTYEDIVPNFLNLLVKTTL